MKTWRIHFRSKGGDQIMLLAAPTKEKAEQDARRAQYRRHERFPLTFDRLQQAHDKGEMTPDMFKSEMEKRKRDLGRYDDDDLKIVKIEEAN